MSAGAGRLGRALRARRRRLRDAALPVLQSALAAGAAFAVARSVVGHPLPFFAPIACVLVLGVSQTDRLRRGAELAVGVSVGVAVGDAIVALIGSGWWQIAVVVALTLGAALLLGAGPLLLNQAAVSAVLVATLQPPGTSAAFSRWVDTLVGAGVGLAVAATLPSHPLTGARRGVDTLLDEMAVALLGAADTLDTRDAVAGAQVLERVRATQGTVDGLGTAIEAGYEITTIAPLRRRHRGELARLRAALGPVDLALRGARVLVRRSVTAVEDGERPGGRLVAPLRGLAEAVGVLRTELSGGESTDGARSSLLDVAHALPATVDGVSSGVVLAQARSVVVDLLCATGVDRVDARTAVTPGDG